jgi:hypothetical protein
VSNWFKTLYQVLCSDALLQELVFVSRLCGTACTQGPLLYNIFLLFQKKKNKHNAIHQQIYVSVIVPTLNQKYVTQILEL